MKNNTLTTKLFLAIAIIFAVVMKAEAVTYTVEAEAGTKTGCYDFASDGTCTYQGGYAVRFGDYSSSDKLEISFSSVTEGVYKVIAHVRAVGDTKPVACSVNNGTATQITTSTYDAICSLDFGSYTLSGNTTVTITAPWGWIDVDYVELVPAGTIFEVGKDAEAENGVFANATTYDNANCSNGKYLYFDNGATLSMTFNITEAGSYKVIASVAGTYGYKEENCTVNGTTKSFTIESSTTFSEKEVGTFTFELGNNTVSFSAGWSYFSMDYVRLEQIEQKWSDASTIEAESEDYVTSSGTGISVVTDASTYSGNKAVHMTNTSDKLVFRFNIDTAGKYKVTVRAKGDDDGKVVNCAVNSASATFTANTAIADIDVSTFHFNEGHNTITITSSYSWVYIDKITISKDETESIEFKIADAPVSATTDAAKRLYAFLKNNFGKTTLSGVMTGDMTPTGTKGESYITKLENQQDWKAVYAASGKYPALLGFDFMEATGLDVDNGATWRTQYTETSVSLAKQLWDQGGIPTFCWHWRDPSRSTNYFYDTSAEGKTETTDFDFTTAMNDAKTDWNKESDVYKNMIKDIDVVAGYFNQLRNQGVACIFRPLHEAAGGWFWWGTQGKDHFKMLYQLIFDEFAKQGVNNVLWNYCHQVKDGNEGWVPDEGMYDIISCDIYNSAKDYQSNFTSFNKLAALSNNHKLIALAECGPIPDVDNQADDEAMWSYWMPWYNSWGTDKFVEQTESSEWTKQMNDSRVIDFEGMPSLASTLTLSDGDDNPYTAKAWMEYSTVSYSRTVKNAYGTIVLPFVPTTHENVTFYTINNVGNKGDVLVLNSVEDANLAANTPYLFKVADAALTSGSATITFSAENATVSPTASSDVMTQEMGGFTMKGTYVLNTKKATEETNNLYYISNNKFWHATGTLRNHPYRAWLEASKNNNAKATFSLELDDRISGIATVENGNIELNIGRIYDLNGRQISNPQHGNIYIVNGKKIIF